MVDVIGYLSLGKLFTAHVTGNLVVNAALLMRCGPPNLAQVQYSGSGELWACRQVALGELQGEVSGMLDEASACLVPVPGSSTGQPGRSRAPALFVIAIAISLPGLFQLCPPRLSSLR
jgi:hypothetical protein